MRELRGRLRGGYRKPKRKGSDGRECDQAADHLMYLLVVYGVSHY
jgi:hypothetical protein